MDYGAGKSIRKKPEEDSIDFFNKLGISIIAHVLFLKISGFLFKKICCFFSLSNTHNAQSSIDYLDRVLDYSILKSIKKIYIWSDNAGHFKNNDLIMHLSDVGKQRNIEFEYNQFCEYEGKDACDQFFGSLSNALENYTKLKPVLDINDLIDFSKEHFKKSGTNEYIFEIYHPIVSKRREDDRGINHVDDFLSFKMKDGEITAALLASQPHTAVKKQKKKISTDGFLVYPKEKPVEEETDKDKNKRKKQENFYNPNPITPLTIAQYDRRMKMLPDLKVNNNSRKILDDLNKTR
jgi:hypothetical protein